MADREYQVIAELNRKKLRIISEKLSLTLEKEEALSWISLAEYGRDTDRAQVLTGKIKKALRNGQKPSDLFTGDYRKVMEAFVPEPYQKSFLKIIDQLNQFQYAAGWKRRSVRSVSYLPWAGQLPNILAVYGNLWLFPGQAFCRLLMGEADSENDMIYLRKKFFPEMDIVLAGELEQESSGTAEAVEVILTSESNTFALSAGLVRGIIMSGNEGLHRLLGKLLLAARLQEGVRQVICENMDCGRAQAFLTLLEVIEVNKLIRFSSIRRAVCTWIGIFEDGNADRLTEKTISLMGRALREVTYREDLVKSEDAVKVSCGLWAMGFYDVGNAIEAMKVMMESGTRHQKMVVSFYNRQLRFPAFEEELARAALLSEYGDLELAACFLPSFMPDVYDSYEDFFEGDRFVHYGGNQLDVPKTCPVTRYFFDVEEAKRFFHVLEDICKKINKKSLEYSPCIFPWHSVSLIKSDVIVKMSVIAYLVGEEALLDKVCGMIGEVSSSYVMGRGSMANLLLYRPKNPYQQRILISLIGNAETLTAQIAFELAKNLVFTGEDYRVLETLIKSKRGEVRIRAEYLLMRQADDPFMEMISRMLQKGGEEHRAAALDMLLELKKASREDPGKRELFQALCETAQGVTELTGKERVLLDEILGVHTDSEEITSKKGFGLYQPGRQLIPKLPITDRGAVSHYLNHGEGELRSILKKLDDLVDEYRLVEYRDEEGNTHILGNELREIKSVGDWGILERFPLEEVWREFYRAYVKNYETAVELNLYVNCCYNRGHYEKGREVVEALFGLPEMPYDGTWISLRYVQQVRQILYSVRVSYQDKAKAFEMAANVSGALLNILTPENCTFVGSEYYNVNGIRMTQHPAIADFIPALDQWRTDGEFEKAFYLKWALEEIFFKAREKEETEDEGTRSPARYSNDTQLPFYYFYLARVKNLISEAELYQAVFEFYRLSDTLAVVTAAREYKEQGGKIGHYMLKQMIDDDRRLSGFPLESAWSEGEPLFLLLDRMHDALVPMILRVELTRGDSSTVFSNEIPGIHYISGTKLFVQVLTALGTEPLERDSCFYYSYYGSVRQVTKRASMSHLLWVSYPHKGEDSVTLKRMLKGTDISEKSLVQAAMFAPQWIPAIEGYLGWKGLKSGCYYFMAHMNTGFDDKKKAVIAKYTPLTVEELQDGVFDVNWFWEAFHQLGEEHFKELYDAAKYIAGGSLHSRARKYADAARGLVTADEVRDMISLKRNKDLLMSYGVIPFREKDRDKDLMERYQYLQEFLKEGRQFGGQRRGSEARAVAIAMKNLSINADYGDVMRLTLNMEARMAEEFWECFQWKQAGEASYRISLDGNGRSSIQVEKDGKPLKSIPSKDKKHEYVMMLSEVNKKLKEQFSRAKRMMEEAMEDGSVFSAGEIFLLGKNPVIAPILERLVFTCGGRLGFLSGGILNGTDGVREAIPDDCKVRLIHPAELYKAGSWHECQKYLFEQKIVQPFKQIFREVYVKLSEELPKYQSLLFAGNQIQPRKTVACLKGRRWIADYEEGLQKVFYKENIVARIYALADWFSPGDIEAPVLEWVEFSDRLDSRLLKIEEIPDVIYSEVMRDVDLAVSLAHAGGVDPQTSHSTVELRKAVIAFNLPLFRLDNVTLDGSHAIIRGTRGEYTVHLGSGVVHQMGGTMIPVLPVHSQKRGKLFLPFVDEDPKTAEIMAKIVLFAEDEKIKDPYILDKICQEM